MIKPTGREVQQTSNGVNKAALFHVEQTVTVPLFCFTCGPKCFYLFAFHLHFNTVCVFCFVRGQDQPTKERGNKNILQRSINYAVMHIIIYEAVRATVTVRRIKASFLTYQIA